MSGQSYQKNVQGIHQGMITWTCLRVIDGEQILVFQLHINMLHFTHFTKVLPLNPSLLHLEEFATSVIFWETKWLPLSNSALSEREQLVAPQQVFVTAETLSFKHCKCMLCWIAIHWHRYKCLNQRAFSIFVLLVIKMDQPTVPALLLTKLKRRHRVFAWKILATSFFHFLLTRLVSSL